MRTELLAAATALVEFSDNAVVRAVGRGYKARFLPQGDRRAWPSRHHDLLAV